VKTKDGLIRSDFGSTDFEKAVNTKTNTTTYTETTALLGKSFERLFDSEIVATLYDNGTGILKVTEL
jgi:hypothetical protein